MDGIDSFEILFDNSFSTRGVAVMYITKSKKALFSYFTCLVRVINPLSC